MITRPPARAVREALASYPNGSKSLGAVRAVATLLQCPPSYIRAVATRSPRRGRPTDRLPVIDVSVSPEVLTVLERVAREGGRTVPEVVAGWAEQGARAYTSSIVDPKPSTGV